MKTRLDGTVVHHVRLLVRSDADRELMARTFHPDTRAPASAPGHPHARYLVVRYGNAWLIKFEGEEFGPYESQREAMLFAVDAAHKLGQQSEPSEVVLIDESGEAKPVWSYGRDPYPPVL